ncbi:MAG: class I SAM-dependent methyltransferase [Brotaphodocola sp.]
MDAIEYYNKYASKIFEDTVDLDMEELRQTFLTYLEEGDTILDLGCGSGRDSLAFYELGYDVTPLDASEEMCKLAEIHTGLEVLQMRYEDMTFDDVFDGIWGAAALIHIPEKELETVLVKLIDALYKNGTLYLSFREGDFEGFEGKLYYCDYTPEQLERILKETGRLNVEKIWVTDDAGGDADVRWLHVLARKIS